MRKNKIEIMKAGDVSMPELLDEADFDRQMTEEAEPYLARLVRTGRLSPKLDLYYELYPRTPNKGTVVICHGFTESTEKYHELIYYFLKNGYQAAIYDQRGHGQSFRETEDRGLIHVRHFGRYVSDLHVYVHKIVMKQMEPDGSRLFLYAHSMGGCVAARYLEEYPDDFAKAVLNAPMLGLNLGKYSVRSAEAICAYKILTGHGMERIFNQRPFNPDERFEDCSASSEARFSYYHRVRLAHQAYQTGGATYYWGQEAIWTGQQAVKKKEVRKIRTPLLMFMAGQETLVDESAQKRFLRHLTCGTGILVPESRHEIYRAQNPVLGVYLNRIYEFFGMG